MYPGSGLTADLASQHAQRAGVLRALADVPARQRAVIVLRYYEDMSAVETAALLGCSVGTGQEPGVAGAGETAYPSGAAR